MAPRKKRAWTSNQRQRLSAIRHPEQTVPKGYYFDRPAAMAELGDAVPYPETLTQESEQARVKSLLAWRGISWGGGGRNFTKEFPSALFGLWVDSEGLGFALDMLLPDRENPKLEALCDGDPPSFWCGLRRYLFRAEPAEYEEARATVAPIFESLFSAEDYKLRRLRDLIAFAFSRDGAWADRLLSSYLKGDGRLDQLTALLACSLDLALVKRALKKYGKTQWLDLYYIFDLVESLGADALAVLPLFKPDRAPERKRLATAVAIAEKLKAQGC